MQTRTPRRTTTGVLVTALLAASMVTTTVVTTAGSRSSAAAPAGPAAPSATDDRYPRLTGVEFKELYYARLPSLPGVVPITTRPPIYGVAAADSRIQGIAERRGYRLQATPTVGLDRFGGLLLAPDAGRAWIALLDAARRNGTPLQGNSGYRSVDTQRGIFRRQLDAAGRARIGRPYTTAEIAAGRADAAIDSVLRFHSIPGYSRHHIAKTIDMSHAGGSNRTFAGSAAYRWISADNYAVAKRFGFIPNYPPDAGAQGPEPEPWEFAFIGNDAIRCANRHIRVQDPDAARICGGGTTDLGLTTTRDDGTIVWHLRTPPGDTTIPYGTAGNEPGQGDTPIAGDWNGDGTTDLGLTTTRTRFDGTVGAIVWHLRTPQGDTTIPYGTADNEPGQGDTPIAGDWNGDGTTDLGFTATRGRVDGTGGTIVWHLRTPQGDTTIPYGTADTDSPIAGDWNGDGTTDLGFTTTRDDGTIVWHLRTSQGDTTIPYGTADTDSPIAGDWNGDGTTDLGFTTTRDDGTIVWHLRTPQGDTTIPYGTAAAADPGAGDTPVVGDWDGR